MTFVKGHPGYKKKGTKHASTLLMQERRVIFDEEITQVWLDIIRKLPPTYVADQFMGKAVDVGVNIPVDANDKKQSERVSAIIARLTHRG